MRVRFWLYYGICCIGLIGVIRMHIRFVYSLIFRENTAPFYDYVWRWADKPVELFFFVVGAASLLSYSLMVYVVWKLCLKKERSVGLVWQNNPLEAVDLIGIVLLGMLNFSIGFGYWRLWFGELGSRIGDFLWIAMICFPLIITWIIVKYRKILDDHWPDTLSGMQKIYALFIFVAFLQFISLVWPFIARPLNMMGEYLEIPSRTLINDQYVDNAAYYSEHQLTGVQPRYQLERDGISSPQPNPEYCLSIGLNPGVEQLLTATRNRSAYFYDPKKKILCNTGPITLDDWLLIRQTATDKDTLLRAEAWLTKDIEKGNGWQQRVYSAEELEFMSYNRFALEFQLNGIWVLHHHNFVLGPINEYALGKPQRDIFPQYGWLNMVVTSHLLKWMGGITYDRYFKVWYSYFIIYFILLTVLSWMIFRHLGYVALVSTFSAGAMSCIPFIWYFQGPGLNPVRHFFDVFMIAGFYLFLTKERPIYLICALIFSILGILNNAQLGLACLGALVTSISVVWIQKEIVFGRRLLFAIAATVLIGGYIGFGHPFWNEGPLNQYYLMGTSTLPTSASREIVILILCGLFDILLWSHMEKDGCRLKYLVLFLLVYSQGSLLYSLWGSTMTHYLALTTVHVMTFVAFLKLKLEDSSLSINKREVSVFVIFVCSLILLIYGARDNSASQQKYEVDFSQHENYVWNLERAHFISSMSPQLFENSANLISKYSAGPAIHIISKYDTILPFLAKTYSAMPFFELSKFFVTPRELDQSIGKIQQDRPDYLYVDTDIRRDFTIDVVEPRALYMNPLHGYSVIRVQRLALLQKVFEAVQADYELVEQGALISVYKRK